jgi:hypothetical protein
MFLASVKQSIEPWREIMKSLLSFLVISFVGASVFAKNSSTCATGALKCTFDKAGYSFPASPATEITLCMAQEYAEITSNVPVHQNLSVTHLKLEGQMDGSAVYADSETKMIVRVSFQNSGPNTINGIRLLAGKDQDYVQSQYKCSP